MNRIFGEFVGVCVMALCFIAIFAAGERIFTVYTRPVEDQKYLLECWDGAEVVFAGMITEPKWREGRLEFSFGGGHVAISNAQCSLLWVNP